MKKISFIILLCLPFLFISSNVYSEGIDCIRIFENLIQNSSFVKKHSAKGPLKIDLYDVSIANDSIFFKLYDEAYSSKTNLFISGWIEYDYKQRKIFDITYDNLNPIILIYDHTLERKFRHCLNENKIKISDLETRHCAE